MGTLASNANTPANPWGSRVLGWRPLVVMEAPGLKASPAVHALWAFSFSGLTFLPLGAADLDSQLFSLHPTPRYTFLLPWGAP